MPRRCPSCCRRSRSAISAPGASRWPIGGRPGAADTEGMSRRIDKSWTVFDSIENGDHDRCVDLFGRPDGSFGFEEFRRDVEDAGLWTPVAYYSGATYASNATALDAAMRLVAWLGEAMKGRKRGAG